MRNRQPNCCRKNDLATANTAATAAGAAVDATRCHLCTPPPSSWPACTLKPEQHLLKPLKEVGHMDERCLCLNGSNSNQITELQSQ
mmetsp:Transcript_1579/g.2897  ORF Transcript_1579/g.2897 Transcript_1579/m.2897 type:complete len:86 (+) Transcript_1579:171-428(+)